MSETRREGEDASRPRLDARGLEVTRGEATVLRGVDLRLEAGELLAVVGPSGAGKSTLFGALAGELPLARGSVTLDGEDLAPYPLWARARRGLGYVPQGPSVLFGLTVRANLETFRRIALGEVPRADAVVQAAREVGLGARLDVDAGSLSAGERRRLELARALTRRPRVLLCDEPFAGVDPIGAAQLGERLAHLAREGVAVVLADHHVAEALAVCTRAVLLLDGRIAVDEPPDAFRAHALVRTRYLGTWLRDAPHGASGEPPPPGDAADAHASRGASGASS